MFVAGVIPIGFSVHLRQQTWEDTTKLTVSYLNLSGSSCCQNQWGSVVCTLEIFHDSNQHCFTSDRMTYSHFFLAPLFPPNTYWTVLCLWLIPLVSVVEASVSRSLNSPRSYEQEFWSFNQQVSRPCRRLTLMMALVTFSRVHKTLPVPISVMGWGRHPIGYLLAVTATWPKRSVLSHPTERDRWLYLRL